MATLIKTNGTRKTVNAKKRWFTLQELYDAVGCELVQFVYCANGDIVVIDEEGKFNLKPTNHEATKIAAHNMFPGDYIAGDALLCDPNELD